jgi:hypothetical protein
MGNRFRVAVFAAFIALLSFSAGPGRAEDAGPGSELVPLTLPAGAPLHVVLDQTVPIKKAGVAVTGHIADPVYVFDQLVIPRGSQVLGRVTEVETASGKQRALAIANGNFSPLRTAHVEFDTLVLQGGRRIPLHTIVSQGSPSMVHLSADAQKKKKGRVAQTVDQARTEVKAREHEAMNQIKEVKAPGKMQRLEGLAVAELPYHNPKLTSGMDFTAQLGAPLKFGQEERSPLELDHVGKEIPPGSTVYVRLLTPLSSATDDPGAPVKAVVSQPLFSPDHQLILPEGTRLEGAVTQAVPARRLGRNGQLRFVFRRLDLGPETSRQVEASLQGVEAASGAHLQLDSEGGAHAVTPKTQYVAPAIDVVLAAGSLDGLDPHNHDRIEHGLGPQGPDTVGGAVRGGAGFGLVGSVIGVVAHYRPVSAAFVFYGAGWSVYSHVVARGRDVVFAKNTPMEIRFGTHQGPAPARTHTPPARDSGL